MKIKRYTITENNQINKINLEKYITENNISQNEIPKIDVCVHVCFCVTDFVR